jgi:hypothetical protein
MIVIIKPSKKSNYKNVITDEMAIWCANLHYSFFWGKIVRRKTE